MPNLNEMFPSKFLKAEDIDQDYEVTIAEIASDTAGQGDEKKNVFVVYFEEFDKGLCLNKTNGGLIAAQHGSNTDAWKGKKVVLTVEDVQYKGELVKGIRVRRPHRPVAPVRKPLPGGAQPKPANKSQEADDNIPF